MSFLCFCCKCFCATIICTLVLLFVPGIPPHVNYTPFEVEDAPPREGHLAKNHILDNAERLYENFLIGPESIAALTDKEIYTGLHNGDIVKIFGQDFEKAEVVTNLHPNCDAGKICSRPLGMKFDKNKRLIIADAYLGIFALDVKTGSKELLVDAKEAIEGARPLLIDDIDIDADGNIFWTDASSVAPLHDSVIELCSDPSGRFFKYDARTRKSEVLLKNLHFANGVQLSPDQDFVLVSESLRHRVHRYWLKGPKRGTSDIFVSNLPGTPDNIRPRKEGGYYVSLFATRRPDVTDFFQLTSPLSAFRKVLTRATMLVQNAADFVNRHFPNKYCTKVSDTLFSLDAMTWLVDNNESIVVELDASGSLVGSLQGSKGMVKSISETRRVGDFLFFGSPINHYLARIHIDRVKRPKAAPKKEGAKPSPKEEL